MNNKSIEKLYLLDNPKSQISPPTETNIAHLPIDNLSWTDFERLCLRITQTFHSIENCEIYGVPGSKQEGIDIFVIKESEKDDCFQCKKYKEIFPGKLDEIIQEFKKA